MPRCASPSTQVLSIGIRCGFLPDTNFRTMCRLRPSLPVHSEDARCSNAQTMVWCIVSPAHPSKRMQSPGMTVFQLTDPLTIATGAQINPWYFPE
eukprot:2896948-Amphidinium_carterae.1